MRVDAVELGSECSDWRSGSCMIHFCECDEEPGSVYQRGNGNRTGALTTACDE